MTKEGAGIEVAEVVSIQGDCPRVATGVSPGEGYIWDGEMSAHHSPEVLRDDVESSGHWDGFEKTCGSGDSGVSKRLLFEQG